MYRQVVVKAGIFGEILQQQFKKTHGGRLGWDVIIKVKGIKQQIKLNQLNQTNPNHIKVFKKTFIKDVTANPKYEHDQKSDTFTRKNTYQEITNQKTLLAYIQKDNGGLFVSQELLDYTYSDVGKDLEKALLEGRIKKIASSNKNKKDYYVFPNITEEIYNLKDQKLTYFGQDYFMKLCKDNYKDFSLLKSDYQTMEGGGGITTSHQKFNQWVTGYTDLKQLWRKKNQEKQKQKG